MKNARGKKSKRKQNAENNLGLTDFDRLEISELGHVERLELFKWALEDQVKRGIISAQEYKILITEISKMIAEAMEI